MAPVKLQIEVFYYTLVFVQIKHKMMSKSVTERARLTELLAYGPPLETSH